MNLFRLAWIECMKIKWSVVLPLLLLGPLLAIWSGKDTPEMPAFSQMSDWTAAYLMMTQTYAHLFLPVVSAVLAAFMCRMEHQGESWKQILSLSISRVQLVGAKFLVVVLLIGLMQMIYVLGIFLTGVWLGYEGEIPWNMMGKGGLQGWVAVLPLVALQMWASFVWKNFAGALAINVACTIPAILVAQSDLLGPWYLWAQPLLAMMSHEQSWYMVHPATLIGVIGGSLVLFLAGGSLHFARRDW